MKTDIRGNCIRLYVNANESIDRRVSVKLPDGYSYESIHVLYRKNISEIVPYFSIADNSSYHMPPVRSHSPSTLDLLVANPSEGAEIRFVIEKFGQIPDAHYFDKAFEPILTTGDDGNEYKVIPSDQFK